jgi:uncharacterized iron-regulated membrane protein
MRRITLLAITGLLLPFARLLHWLVDQLEEDVSKEQEALKALDEAIDRVAAFQEADDEHDASAIRERTEQLNRLFDAAPGQPIDAATGTPVTGPTSSPGPMSPEEMAAEQKRLDEEQAKLADAPTPPSDGPDAPGAVTR